MSLGFGQSPQLLRSEAKYSSVSVSLGHTGLVKRDLKKNPYKEASHVPEDASY